MFLVYLSPDKLIFVIFQQPWSCPYHFTGLGNWVGGDEENANYRGTHAQFFFSVLDLVF